MSESQLESGNEAPSIRLEVQAILPAHWGTHPPPTREELGITLAFDPVQLRTRALSEEAEAQGKLALCLRIGWGMRRNLVEAFHWAALAAQQNDLTGRFEHAYHWGIGSHPPFDLKQAMQMHTAMVPELTAAAEAGSDEAYLQLSFIHSMKLVPEASQESALELLNKSARSYPRAWATISHLLSSPPKDYEKGTRAQIISWNRLAADRGLAKPMNMLAVQLLGNPRPTETNKQDVYRLFIHAAEKGYPMAQLNLGKVLHNGILLEENPNEGDQWIKRAARYNQLAANEWADRLLNQKASGESDRSNTGLPMPGSPAERTQINLDQIPAIYTYFRRASLGRNKSVAKQAMMQRIRWGQKLPLNTLLQIETRERQQLPGVDYAREIAQSIEGESATLPFPPYSINLWPSTAILVSMKTARQREIDNLATLQTNVVANHLLATLYALDQIAPERLNRNLSQDRNFLLQTRLPGKINTRDKVVRLNTDTRTLIALAFLNDKEGYRTVRNDLTQAQPETPSYEIKLTYARSLLLIDPDPKHLLMAEQLVNSRTPGTSKSAHPEIAFLEAFIHYRRGEYQKAHQILEADRLNNPDTAYEPNVPPPPTESNRKKDSPFSGIPTFFSNTILCATIPHILMEGILHDQADRPSAARGAHLLAKAHLDHLWTYENRHVGAYLDDWIFCQLLERELTGLLATPEIDNE